MARKNLLENLMKGGEDSPPSPAQPRRSAGAIGAVSQSLADLKMRALVEVPPDLIDDAGLDDRLDSDPEGIAALCESIREYGQQVPVMLRHSPSTEGRFEIVYGRRRVAALKQLRQPVRAMVRDLSDKDLIVAQGQENSARRDLTFIEKARFAQQMEQGGFDRKVICDALHIDKTVVSRMLTVADAVPEPVIRAIGAAPSAGRDRWMALAKLFGDRTPQEVAALAHGETSDSRFKAVYTALARPKPAAAPEVVTGADGRALAQVRRKRGQTTVTMTSEDGFDIWLIENFDRLHRDYLAGLGEDEQ